MDDIDYGLRHKCLESLGFRFYGDLLNKPDGAMYISYIRGIDKYYVDNMKTSISLIPLLMEFGISGKEWFRCLSIILTEARKEIRLEKRKEIIDKVLGQ